MARIPDDELERLKNDIPLLRLVEAKGFQLVRHGAKDWAIKCPLHDGDDTPSCVISPDVNQFHCFACGKGGDVIRWVELIEGVSFRHAVEILRRDYPLAAAVPRQKPGKVSTTAKLPCALSRDADEQALALQVAQLYHENLMGNDVAKDYLRQREIWDEGLARFYKLGYANRTLGYQLPKKNRLAGAELRGKLGGDEGAKALAPRLLAEGFGCFRILFPHGMDANEYARKVKPAAKSLALLVRSAVWMGNGATPPRPEPLPAAAPPPPAIETTPALERVPAAKEKTMVDPPSTVLRAGDDVPFVAELRRPTSRGKWWGSRPSASTTLPRPPLPSSLPRTYRSGCLRSSATVVGTDSTTRSEARGLASMSLGDRSTPKWPARAATDLSASPPCSSSCSSRSAMSAATRRGFR